jgi:hypothetical protein
LNGSPPPGATATSYIPRALAAAVALVAIVAGARYVRSLDAPPPPDPAPQPQPTPVQPTAEASATATTTTAPTVSHPVRPRPRPSTGPTSSADSAPQVPPPTAPAPPSAVPTSGVAYCKSFPTCNLIGRAFDPPADKHVCIATGIPGVRYHCTLLSPSQCSIQDAAHNIDSPVTTWHTCP